MTRPQDDDRSAAQPTARHTHRVRITASRRTAATARRGITPAAALVEQTGVGELYLRGLLRAQLRLALGVLAVVATTLLGLPVLFVLAPSLAQAGLLGVPLPWIALGVGVYPVMIAAAAWYATRAQRLERSFTDVVTRSGE